MWRSFCETIQPNAMKKTPMVASEAQPTKEFITILMRPHDTLFEYLENELPRNTSNQRVAGVRGWGAWLDRQPALAQPTFGRRARKPSAECRIIGLVFSPKATYL
jgi:hypothetical protein